MDDDNEEIKTVDLAYSFTIGFNIRLRDRVDDAFILKWGREDGLEVTVKDGKILIKVSTCQFLYLQGSAFGPHLFSANMSDF